MLNGIIISVGANLENNSVRLRCQCVGCADSDVYIKNNSNSQYIEVGDSIMLGYHYVYWTPKDSDITLSGINYDIPIEIITT
jgi:hypothetical protein